MTREQLVELVYIVESKYPVSLWEINNVDVWPIVKINLFFFYFNKNLSTDQGIITNQPSIKKRFSRISDILNGVIAYAGFIMFKTEKVDLLLSAAGSHYTLYNGEYVNKFFHPVEQWFKNEKGERLKFKKVIFGNHLPRKSYPQKNIIHLHPLVIGFKFIGAFGRKPSRTRAELLAVLPEADKVSEFLSSQKINPAASTDGFLKYISNIMSEIEVYQKLFAKILKESRPQMAVELCYYSKANFALNVEARKRGIPTLEIMHGGIGPQHAAYAGWEDGIPGDGYNVLPKTIWVWDEVSNNVVSSWISKQSFHSSFVGGQPWIDFMRSETDSYTDYFAGNKKIILYTLQFDTIDDYIYDAIEKCNDEYEWWLRLHPRKMYAKDAIAEKTDLLGITHKINIEAANDLPLPAVLAHTHIHLSEFSGAITEACLLGIPTVILNEVGVENYQAYITTGECQVSTGRNPDHLLELIYESRKMHPKRTSSKIPYSEIFKKVL